MVGTVNEAAMSGRSRMGRVSGWVAGLALVASSVVAVPAAADEDPSLAERMSWTAEERRAHGEAVAPDLPSTEPVVAEETGGEVEREAPNAADEGDAPGGDTRDPAALTGLGAKWPFPGRAAAPGLDRAAQVTAGSLPVRLEAAADEADAVARLAGNGARVESLGRERAEDVGVAGAMFTLSGTTGTVAVPQTPGQAAAARQAAPGRLNVSVDYSGFGAAYGGEWASRLRLVQLPGCALTTPKERACTIQRPVQVADGMVANDAEARTVSGVVTVGGVEPVVLAVAADTAGSAGDWGVTSLAAEATWEVSANSGDYSYSYPMRVPPTAGGLVPQVSLGYSSGSVDGRVSTTNNQTSVVGDGWELNATGYIERKYVSCADDTGANPAGELPNNATRETGDLCWKSDNATLLLNGRALELVKDQTTGVWRALNDDNTRFERLTAAQAWNSDNDHEAWKVTTADGVQYYFGRDQRSATDTARLNSSWVTQVYGNHPGEPCHQATFSASRCQQTWRWNLDYVVDLNQNTMTYFYARDANRYEYNQGEGVSAYQRGGVLSRIEYGTRTGAESAPPVKVEFAYQNRCLPATAAECQALTAATKASWPDVPYDLICDSNTSCPGRYSPSHFITKRLSSVATSIRKADGTYRAVDQWVTDHAYPATLPGPALVLSSLTHTGVAGAASANNVPMPSTKFEYIKLANRIDVQGDAQPPMNRHRLSAVTTEAGGTVNITYSGMDCSPTSKPAVESNKRRCFPVWYTPPGQAEPVMEFFHKYVVTDTVTSGNLAGAGETRVHYQYPDPSVTGGGGAWRYTDDEIIPADQRTWSQWRGYGFVDVYTGTAGNPDQPRTHARHRFFRGLDGDRLNGGGGTTDVKVDGLDDHDQFAGMTRELITFDQAAVVSRTVSDPWRSAATATGPNGQAFHVATQAVQTHTVAPLLPGGERVARSETEFDSYGMAVAVNDLAEVGLATDDQCTRTEYARNTTLNILGTVKRVEKVAKSCDAASVARPGDVISDTRTWYSTASYATNPTDGLPRRVEDVSSYDSAGAAVYTPTQRFGYDEFGRPTSLTDGGCQLLCVRPDHGPFERSMYVREGREEGRDGGDGCRAGRVGCVGRVVLPDRRGRGQADRGRRDAAGDDQGGARARAGRRAVRSPRLRQGRPRREALCELAQRHDAQDGRDRGRGRGP